MALGWFLRFVCSHTCTCWRWYGNALHSRLFPQRFWREMEKVILPTLKGHGKCLNAAEALSNYHFSSWRDLRVRACTKLASHIANDYVVKHVENLYICSAGLKTKFLFCIRFSALIHDENCNEIMRYFLLLAHEKIFTFSCTFLRHKSVIKLHSCCLYFCERAFIFMCERRKIITENYKNKIFFRKIRTREAWKSKCRGIFHIWVYYWRI